MTDGLGDTFARLLGRQPSEAEKTQLYRVKEALGLQNNDAVWLIFMGLQYHESLYSKHPARIEEAARKAVLDVTGGIKVAARAEVARSHRALAEAVAAASAAVAATRAEAVRWASWGWAAAALVLFGAFSMVCGFEMGRGSLPFWLAPGAARGEGALVRVVAAILGAPAGWVVFVLVLPAAAWWTRRGWILGREGQGRARLKGWGIVGGSVAAALASLFVLVRLTRGLF